MMVSTCFAANETPFPPSVSFISIHSSFASLPGVYIDEWGNARINAFCKDGGAIDLRLGDKRYREAASILRSIKFHTLPFNLEYRYEREDDEWILIERKCDHCPHYRVTFNDGRFWNMHTVEFWRMPDETDERFEAIERVIRVVTRDQEDELCKQ